MVEKQIILTAYEMCKLNTYGEVHVIPSLHFKSAWFLVDLHAGLWSLQQNLHICQKHVQRRNKTSTKPATTIWLILFI